MCFYKSINIFVYFVLLVIIYMSNRSTLPPIDTPRSSKRKRLDLTDNSSNFVYYSPHFRPLHIIPNPSRNVLDASSY